MLCSRPPPYTPTHVSPCAQKFTQLLQGAGNGCFPAAAWPLCWKKVSASRSRHSHNPASAEERPAYRDLLSLWRGFLEAGDRKAYVSQTCGKDHWEVSFGKCWAQPGSGAQFPGFQAAKLQRSCRRHGGSGLSFESFSCGFLGFFVFLIFVFCFCFVCLFIGSKPHWVWGAPIFGRALPSVSSEDQR